MSITGAAKVAELINNTINKIWPDKAEQEKAQLAAAMAIIQNQIEVNKAEATNPNLFVSGWRPATGWICLAAVAWNWIGIPIARIILAIAEINITVSPADVTEMLPILAGMLGLGGLRTIEKLKGVSGKN